MVIFICPFIEEEMYLSTFLELSPDTNNVFS